MAAASTALPEMVTTGPKLPALVKAISQLEIESGWLDGEIVVLNDKGLPDFGALQNAFDQSSTSNIVYYVFDLPWFDSLDLRGVRLADRREILRNVITKHHRTVFDSAKHSTSIPLRICWLLLPGWLEGLIGNVPMRPMRRAGRAPG